MSGATARASVHELLVVVLHARTERRGHRAAHLAQEILAQLLRRTEFVGPGDPRVSDAEAATAAAARSELHARPRERHPARSVPLGLAGHLGELFAQLGRRR